MHYLWLAIASTVIVAVLGAVYSMGRITETMQKKAATLSFGMLGFVGVASCAVVMNGFGNFAWVLAFLIAVLPTVVYAFAISSAKSENNQAFQVLASHRKASGSTRERPFSALDSPVAALNERARIDVSGGRAGAMHAQATSARRVERERTIREVQPVREPERARVAEICPAPAASIAAPASVPAPAPEPTPTPASAPAPALAPKAVEPSLQMVRAPLPAASLQEKPVPEPTPRPKSEPARVLHPDPGRAPVRPTNPPICEKYFEKAMLLKDAGALLVAANLFAASAAQADSSLDRRHARFEELSCYVKAGEAERARTLAQELRAQTGTMTKVERVKLDAVLRMQ